MGFFSGRDHRTPSERIENIVGLSTTLKGSILSDGGVRIDGNFEGTIQVGGNVIVGESGQVKGDIVAKNVTVGGQVVGNIDGQGRLEILATGQVLGDICVATVMIDEGGVFQGISRIRGFEQRALAAPSDAAPAAKNTTVVDVVANRNPSVSPAKPAAEPVMATNTQAHRDGRSARPTPATSNAAKPAPQHQPTPQHQRSPQHQPTTGNQKPASPGGQASPRVTTPPVSPGTVKRNSHAEVDLDAIEPIILDGKASASQA